MRLRQQQHWMYQSARFWISDEIYSLSMGIFRPSLTWDLWRHPLARRAQDLSRSQRQRQQQRQHQRQQQCQYQSLWQWHRSIKSVRKMIPQAKQEFNPSGWLSSFRDVLEISKSNILLVESNILYHYQRQHQHHYQSFWQRRRRSESERTTSPWAKQVFNPSGWISSFWAVCELSKATLLLGEYKSLSHRQRRCQCQYQLSWQRRRRIESEWKPSHREKRRFIPSVWISSFWAVREISEATLLLGECKRLSCRKLQFQRQHQSLWQRRWRSEYEQTTSLQSKRVFIFSGWLFSFQVIRELSKSTTLLG